MAKRHREQANPSCQLRKRNTRDGAAYCPNEHVENRRSGNIQEVESYIDIQQSKTFYVFFKRLFVEKFLDFKKLWYHSAEAESKCNKNKCIIGYGLPGSNIHSITMGAEHRKKIWQK